MVAMARRVSKVAAQRLKPIDPSVRSVRAPRPPLESGDCLTRVEFERRYEARPDLKKAELIDGVVYVPSPLKNTHGRWDSLVAAWLVHYAARTPGTAARSNTSVRLDQLSEPQPDEHLRILPEHGGRARVDADDLIVGAPELIVEVASSSTSYDLHQKKDVYRRHGVLEYLVIVTDPGEILWHIMEEGRYATLGAGPPPGWRGRAPKGRMLCSRAFPGLWLDVAAALAGEDAKVLDTLERGLASPEHAAFVRRLALARRRRRPG